MPIKANAKQWIFGFFIIIITAILFGMDIGLGESNLQILMKITLHLCLIVFTASFSNNIKHNQVLKNELKSLRELSSEIRTFYLTLHADKNVQLLSKMEEQIVSSNARFKKQMNQIIKDTKDEQGKGILEARRDSIDNTLLGLANSIEIEIKDLHLDSERLHGKMNPLASFTERKQTAAQFIENISVTSEESKQLPYNDQTIDMIENEAN